MTPPICSFFATFQNSSRGEEGGPAGFRGNYKHIFKTIFFCGLQCSILIFNFVINNPLNIFETIININFEQHFGIKFQQITYKKIIFRIDDTKYILVGNMIVIIEEQVKL